MTGKLIFFDIDGTLLDHDKRLPDSTKRAINELKRAGHEVAIATGRGPFMFEWLRDELGIDSFVSYNGQYVVRGGEVVATNPIKRELLDRLTEEAARNGHPIVYMSSETMKSNTDGHERIEKSITELKVKLPEHDPEFYIGQEIYQCLLFCTYGEEGIYKDAFRGELDFIRWHQFSTDVLPLGGSKAAGIEAFIRHAGVRREDVYAFGDALNDIEMLQYVGNGIAMGNAIDSVKAAAKYVTRDVDDDGIRYGLRMVGLL
ncbi:phosphatase [Paenibacillus sp. 32O-W]|jgi:HAD-superfamily hydrolase, subfamily IIB|uniref:Cof-type HAD-IIB family hydrolase n=1 Tax=Paenibacillus sp. 32O-W TaxID=1695218 RepID=UPI0007213FB7|nr:Cof-type HAD-IIB family hydrolase [Paenibacillus sp. 32O-W]ALS28328.1 phosphatase [Paenibacillus sp. 32O-W]